MNQFPIIVDGDVKKPKGCQLCSLYKKVGFVPDGLLEDTDLTLEKLSLLKMVVIQEMPSKEESALFAPLTGAYGYHRWKQYFEKTGWQREEVGFSYIRRCYSGIKEGRPMISAAEAKDAVVKCRQYDVILKEFKPDTALVTHSFSDVLKTEAYYRMVLADLNKARVLTDRGLRVILLVGHVPQKAYLPSLDGKKAWAGSWWSL